MDTRGRCDASCATDPYAVKAYITYTYDNFSRTRHYFPAVYISFNSACRALEEEISRRHEPVSPCRETLQKKIDDVGYVFFHKHEEGYYVIRALPVVE